MKRVLWIDDDGGEREFGEAALSAIGGIQPMVAAGSRDAEEILSSSTPVDAIVTDILRRDRGGAVSPTDDGYEFVQRFVRPRWPTMPVVYHTKNMPESFELDDTSHYLSKWEAPAKKQIELEQLLSGAVALYEAFADYSVWHLVEPRLVEIHSCYVARPMAQSCGTGCSLDGRAWCADVIG